MAESGTAVDDLRLDRAEAQRIRDRVARIIEQAPADLAQPRMMTMQATPVRPDVARFGGANRYEVAANLADHYWGQYFWNPKYGAIDFQKVVFVASGATFTDALSGGAAAAAWGGPMLLTAKDGIPEATRKSLTLLKPDVIVVLGGTSTVTAKVEQDLYEYVRTPANVSRVAGANRYEVSANLATMIGWSDVAYVVSGQKFPDGLAGGAVAGAQSAPLLLTSAGSVPPAVLKALQQDVLPTRIVVLGGPSTVSEDVVQTLKKHVTPNVTRVNGKNRYEVAGNITDLLPTEGIATIANGQKWPDALAGSALAGLTGSKLLLVTPSTLPVPTSSAITRHKLAVIDVLGGPVSVQDQVLTALRKL